MNHILEVVSLDRIPDISQMITRLSKDQYILNETGEILDYKHNEHRGQNLASLKRTFKKLRWRLSITISAALPTSFSLPLHTRRI